MLWTAPPPARKCHGCGCAVKAPTIWRSQICKRSRQSVSTSPSRFFKCTALMLPSSTAKIAPTGPFYAPGGIKVARGIRNSSLSRLVLEQWIGVFVRAWNPSRCARGIFAGWRRLKLYEKGRFGALLCLELAVVSNRVSVPNAAGEGTAGGLAVALQVAFQAYQGLWFGWSGKAASKPASQPRMVDKGRVQYALMDLTSLDRREYYNGFANRALWPTMHYRVGLSDFSRADYAGYLRVNRTFAARLRNLSVRATSCGCTTII